MNKFSRFLRDFCIVLGVVSVVVVGANALKTQAYISDVVTGGNLLEVETDIICATGFTCDLGSTVNPFDNLYVNNAIIYTSITAEGVSIFAATNTTQVIDVVQSSTGLVALFRAGSQQLETTPLLRVASSSGATLFEVQGSGRVGLSTTTPSARLSIEATAGEDSLVVGSSIATYFKVSKSGQVLVPSGQLLVTSGNATLPGIATFANLGTGIRIEETSVRISIGETNVMIIDSARINTSNSNGGALQNEITSRFNPTVIAGRADDDTGMGRAALDKLSLIAGAKEGIRVINSGGSDVNYLRVVSSPTGSGITLNATGTDAVVDFLIIPKGGGNVGIGTTTPRSVLSVSATAQSSTNLLTVASTTNAVYFQVQSTGDLLMANSKWLRALDSTGLNTINMFKASTSGEILVGSSLVMDGGITLPENTTLARLFNISISDALPQTSSSIITFAHDNSDIMTWYAESNGSGGVQNQRIGIGTTTPRSIFNVEGIDAATTTISWGQFGESKGVCVNQTATDGSIWRRFLTSSGVERIISGACGTE